MNSNSEQTMEERFGQGDVNVVIPIEEDDHSDHPKVKLRPNAELENFLEQVEAISDVVKALASEDLNENERGLRRADILLRDAKDGDNIDVDKVECQVTSDRSVINKIPDEPKDEAEMNTQAWMKMVEKDANERAQDRKERKVKSDAFRKKGNILFTKKDFAGALFNYNEAIKLIKDSPCLYNNRALTYIRLGIFSSAIEDCKRALDLEEFSLRARMFMAKAYFLMEEPDQCRQILEESREKLPGHVELINDYHRELFNLGSEKPFEYDLDVEQKWKAAAKYEHQGDVPLQPDEKSSEKVGSKK